MLSMSWYSSLQLVVNSAKLKLSKNPGAETDCATRRAAPNFVRGDCPQNCVVCRSWLCHSPPLVSWVQPLSTKPKPLNGAAAAVALFIASTANSTSVVET